MKANDKKRIQELREAGLTYREISDETGIAFGTVKMFFQRQKDKPAVQRCEQCRRPLRQDVTRAGRRFCSDRCRIQWWTAHPDRMSSSGKHSFSCAGCGKVVISRRPGKYCSRACYQASRKGGAPR